MEKAKSKDGWAKLLCLGIAVLGIEAFARQHDGSLFHNVALIASGMGDWFGGLGVFAPVAALIALFCLDGFFSGFRK